MTIHRFLAKKSFEFHSEDKLHDIEAHYADEEGSYLKLEREEHESGGFSSIYLFYHPKTQKKIIIKEMQRDVFDSFIGHPLSKKDFAKMVAKESTLMDEVQGDVRFKISEDGEKAWIKMPLLKGISLINYIYEISNHFNDQITLEMVLAKLITALEFSLFIYEKYNIIHGDLSIKNILVDAKTDAVTLCDFGLSGKKGDSRIITSHYSMPAFAPEIKKGATVHPNQDIFGMGNVIRVLMAKQFDGSKLAYLMEEIANKMQSELPAQRPTHQEAIALLRTAHLASAVINNNLTGINKLLKKEIDVSKALAVVIKIGEGTPESIRLLLNKNPNLAMVYSDDHTLLTKSLQTQERAISELILNKILKRKYSRSKKILIDSIQKLNTLDFDKKNIMIMEMMEHKTLSLIYQDSPHEVGVYLSNIMNFYAWNGNTELLRKLISDFPGVFKIHHEKIIQSASEKGQIKILDCLLSFKTIKNNTLYLNKMFVAFLKNKAYSKAYALLNKNPAVFFSKEAEKVLCDSMKFEIKAGNKLQIKKIKEMFPTQYNKHLKKIHYSESPFKDKIDIVTQSSFFKPALITVMSGALIVSTLSYKG